ncbi:MAG: hypothetical protein JWN40_5325, partial [Phycisphaerales bacterium]|nr:hypothetical protein [Phycisphaerales bacterium]
MAGVALLLGAIGVLGADALEDVWKGDEEGVVVGTR